MSAPALQTAPASITEDAVPDSVATTLAEFHELRNALLAQYLPTGRLENEILHAHAWSLYLAERLRAHELDAQTEFDENPSHTPLLRRLDSLARLRARHETSAARSLNELRRAQADRFAAAESNALLADAGAPQPLPASLPADQIKGRRSANSHSLASDALFAQPRPTPSSRSEAKEFFTNTPTTNSPPPRFNHQER